MNDETKVMNSLHNYYAVSKILSEKKGSGLEYEYLISMKALIQGLLNNAFSLALYKNGMNALEKLARFEKKELMDCSFYETYNELADISIFDAKNLRKYDPIESVLKVVIEFAKRYSNEENIDNELATKNRYDVIFNELFKDDTYAKILLKMTITEMNIINKKIVELKKEYKPNVFFDAIIEIKNIIYETSIAVIFKDYYLVETRYDCFLNICLPILKLYERGFDLKELIKYLEMYSDMHFSKKHQLPLSVMALDNLPKYLYNNYSFIDKFSEPYGFLISNDGTILKPDYLKSYYKIERFNKNRLLEVLLVMDRLIINLFDYIDNSFANELKQILNDKIVIAKELNV